MRLISNEELILVSGGGDGSEGDPVIAAPVVTVGHPIHEFEPGSPGPDNGNTRNPTPSPYQPPITKIE